VHDRKGKARGDVRKVELNRKTKAVVADVWSCTGIVAISGFADDDSGQEEGSEGTRGVWLSDVTVVLRSRIALVVRLTPAGGSEILTVLGQT